MRSFAARTSSMEQSSGSLFISQYAIACSSGGEKSPPMAVGSAPEPWLNRVVAFRSHQVHPAREAWDDHNSDTSPQPEEAIGSENMSPVAHSRDRISF